MTLPGGCARDSVEPAEGPGAAAEVAASEQTATYIGSAACGACHADAFTAWSDSHHALAMQPASDASVRAPFAGEHFAGVMFDRDGNGYFVREGGARLPVRYTFGAQPLQQYLVDVGDGRLQALDIAWDTRPAEAGGQRWYGLWGDGVRPPPGDPLHWRGLGYNWNSACADCHSTDVRRGHTGAGHFDSHWAEVTVGCEACHGPGSKHAADPDAGYARFLTEPRRQVEACAPCHSRRSQIAEGWRPGNTLLDHYVPALLQPPLYAADGQIHDEVYVYGSFVQSRMYARGVTCTDCHDSHSGALRAAGDALCLGCHNSAPPPRFPTLRAAAYDSPAHHFHPTDSAGARCTSCHMPARTYMGVDERHDHSLRIPDPWLAATRGTPDPCTRCHTDHDPQWAVMQLTQRGIEPPVRHGAVLARLAAADPTVEREAAALAGGDAAPLVRATALAALAGYQRGYSADALLTAIADDAPLVRHAAALGAARLLSGRHWRALLPLLRDPVLAVRTQAAVTMLARGNALAGADRRALAAALDEYMQTQRLHADQPAAHTNLAAVHAGLGDLQAAEAELERALQIAPYWLPAHLNLADLYRATGRDAAALEHLQAAVELDPDSAEAAYALGLWHVRQRAYDGARQQLARAWQLAPTARRYALALALTEAQLGNTEGAIAVLQQAADSSGFDRDLHLALIAQLRAAGRPDAARAQLQAMLRDYPLDADAQAMLRELSGGS